MERLEAKLINGLTYYYYSAWARVNGKTKRLWQKYLGKPSDIAQIVLNGGPNPLCADVFEWGLPEALAQLCSQAEIADCVNRQCSRRKTPTLSTGDYLAIAALNRAIRPQSKRSLWHWFSQTTLLRRFPQASQNRLSSQRFWDHMDRIQEADVAAIWQDILQRLLKREAFDLSSICYDGTNYYTFIDTFNARCDMPQRGKNKQGRSNLRQVSYALFCCADGQLPLYFDVYNGNRNDAKEFPQVLAKFHAFLKTLGQTQVPTTTLIFDKGNNSADNFKLLDDLKLHYVGSVKLDEHKELMQVPNDDSRFMAFADMPSTKAFRIKKTVYGKERTLVVTYNQNLFDAQYRTVQNDIVKASKKLSALQKRLADRVSGEIKGGKTPTVASVERQSKAAIGRQHLKKIIDIEVSHGKNGIPVLKYGVNASALETLTNTYLGKTLLISNRGEWSDEQIITAYRSQYLIEEMFKESKDRTTGNWWPMHHWTDSKIRVHGLYCTIAQLLRALLMRRVKQGGIKLSMKRLLANLSGIKEVINVFPSKKGQKERQQTVLSRCTKMQKRLIGLLGLEEPKKGV